MKWIQIPLGPIETNCYILYNREKECIIFDPGDQGEYLNSYIKRKGFRPLAIMMTHAHFDHIGAVDLVREEWKIPVYIHEKEAEWLTNPALNGSARYGVKITAKSADHLLSKEEPLAIGSFLLHIFHTPGHSPGSISYYLKETNTIFAGDTLFEGSIGRTDLPGGNHSQLLTSIKSKLFNLPDSAEVLPGHGAPTTIKKEKESNPFLK